MFTFLSNSLMFSSSPSQIICTVPSSRFFTYPLRFKLKAISSMKSLKPAFCTRPDNTISTHFSIPKQFTLKNINVIPYAVSPINILK